MLRSPIHGERWLAPPNGVMLGAMPRGVGAVVVSVVVVVVGCITSG